MNRFSNFCPAPFTASPCGFLVVISSVISVFWKKWGSLPKKWREWVLPPALSGSIKLPSVCCAQPESSCRDAHTKGSSCLVLTHTLIKTDDRVLIRFFPLPGNTNCNFSHYPLELGRWTPARDTAAQCWIPCETRHVIAPGRSALSAVYTWRNLSVVFWRETNRTRHYLLAWNSFFLLLQSISRLWAVDSTRSFSAAAAGPARRARGSDAAGCSGWFPPSLSCHLSCSCFAGCRRPSVSSPSHLCTCVPVSRAETLGRWTGLDRIDVVKTGLQPVHLQLKLN